MPRHLHPKASQAWLTKPPQNPSSTFPSPSSPPGSFGPSSASPVTPPSPGYKDGACEKALTKAASDGNLCRLRALVRKEIEGETDRLTGRSNQMSPVPIHLSIYSPQEGQPESTAQYIENMVPLHVEKTKCIILDISPANQDIATSGAIKLARDVDPTGERTFGVLTKLDLMDNVTNALAVLGGAYKLEYPWTGVVNCSQADINRNAGMIIFRKKEQEFFDSSPEYAHLASRMASAYLAKIFSQQLEAVISAHIPSITYLINKTIDELESEMDHLGRPIGSDDGAQLYLVLELCRAYDKLFKEHLDGGRPGGGDRIYVIFDELFSAPLWKLPFDRYLFLQNVKRIASQSDGYQPHLIAPEHGCRRLIEPGLSYFRGRAEASVDAVHHELKELVTKCKSKCLVEQLKGDVNAPGYGAVALGLTPFTICAKSADVVTIKYCKEVEMLFPLTSPVPNVPNWRIEGVISHAKTEDKKPRERHAAWRQTFCLTLMSFIFISFISTGYAESVVAKCPKRSIDEIFPRNTCQVIHLTGDHWLHSKRVSKNETPVKKRDDDDVMHPEFPGCILINEHTWCDRFFDILLGLSIISLWKVVWQLRQNQHGRHLFGHRNLILVWIDVSIVSIFYHSCWSLYGYLLFNTDKKLGAHIYCTNILACTLFLVVLAILLFRHITVAQASWYVHVRLMGLLSLVLLFYYWSGARPDKVQDTISTVGMIGFGAMIPMYIFKLFTIVGVKRPAMVLNILALFLSLGCDHHGQGSWYDWAFVGSLVYKSVETAIFFLMLYRKRVAGRGGVLHQL